MSRSSVTSFHSRINLVKKYPHLPAYWNILQIPLERNAFSDFGGMTVPT